MRLVRDPSLDDRDEFGRLLRYVTIGGSNVNVELVRRGGAAPYFYRKTRGRHADALERAVEGSVAAGRGLWGACPQARLNPQRRLDTGPS